MTETVTAERVDVEVQEAPAPQLPAVRQERKPSAKRALATSAPTAAVFPPKIAVAILKITKEIGVVHKEGVNAFQHYNYARWEDINEKLSPLLAENGLIIVQTEQTRNLLEENDKGSVLAIVYHFTVVNEHGEQWPPVEWTAIARLRDQKGITDDKAASKCHTQAEKMFSIKLFKIRTAEGIDDEDQQPTLPKKDARDVYLKLQAEIDTQTSVTELVAWGNDNVARKRALPTDWQDILTTRYNEKLQDLKNQSEKVEWREDGEYDPRTGEVKPNESARR